QSESPDRSLLRQPGDKNGAKRAFFGRRKGHSPRPGRAALSAPLLPRLALPLSNAAPADPRALFAVPVDALRLEIGFGGAEHLIAKAQANPRIGFIATDAFVNAVAKALVAIDERTLTNIRLHFGDASELLDWMPDASISQLDLLYPDSWPKRRHWKRRFIQDDNLRRLGRILKTDGELRFATDRAEHAAYARARVFRSTDFVWTAECADDWRKPWTDFGGTRYEAKAKREGRC